MHDFCDALHSIAPSIRMETENPFEGVPLIQIADNVVYQAVPEGPELSPFLEFLKDSQTPHAKDLPDRETLDRITAPVTLTVFIAPHCPHCPDTVSAILCLAKASNNIHVRVVDGEMFSQTAAKARVRSAPTTILDDDFRWTGAVDLSEIVNAIIHRDPANLGAETLQQMIEEKSPEAVSRMMIDGDRVYPALLDLLTHEKWSVRLGAMVVFEFINTESDSLAHEVLDALWARFESATDDVKGDILYLYGESGRSEIKERLSAAQSGPYGEAVREAAAEALETLIG